MDKVLAKEPLNVPVDCSFTRSGTRKTSTARICRLQGHQAARHGQRQSLPRDRSLAPRAGDRDASDHSAPSTSAQTPALYFRQNVLAPFLAHYLKDGAPAMDIAPVTAFETGINKWRAAAVMARRLRATAAPASPRRSTSSRSSGSPSGYPIDKSAASKPIRRVYLRSRQARALPPATHPARGLHAASSPGPAWLVDDQREASGRPDVLSFRHRSAYRSRSRSADSPSRISSLPPPAPTPIGS